MQRAPAKRGDSSRTKPAEVSSDDHLSTGRLPKKPVMVTPEIPEKERPATPVESYREFVVGLRSAFERLPTLSTLLKNDRGFSKQFVSDAQTLLDENLAREPEFRAAALSWLASSAGRKAGKVAVTRVELETTQREITGMRKSLTMRIERAIDLTSTSGSEVPKDVELLSRSEELDLTQALDESRTHYWQRLFMFAPARDGAVAAVSPFARGEVNPERIIFTRKSDSRTVTQLRKCAVDAVSTTARLTESEDGVLSKGSRWRTAVLLCEVPLHSDGIAVLHERVTAQFVSLADRGAALHAASQSTEGCWAEDVRRHNLECARFAGKDATIESIASEMDEMNRYRDEYFRIRKYLARANTKLVFSVAKKYRNRGRDMDDIHQEGEAGLMRAIEKYDHKTTFKLSTYATWWIRQSITRSIRENTHIVDVPVHAVEDISALRHAAQVHGLGFERDSDVAKLAVAVKMSVVDVKRLIRVSTPAISLHSSAPPGSGDYENDFMNILADTKTRDAGDQSLLNQLRERMGEVLLTLTKRERDVLEMRFGMRDGEVYTLEQIAKVFKISRERVRQIQTRAIVKLRHPVRAQRLQGFVDLGDEH